MYDTRLKMSQIVGKGYNEFWKFKGRYRVVKGSRASKKSKTSALWYMANLSKEKYRQANLLVIRKTYRTLKDSCFTELKWAINRLGLQNQWVAKESPLEIVNVETGQKIFFRGLDDPLKVTSITVDVGVLCWLWIEEAYELMQESDFDTIDESIRGEVPEGLFKQITLTFNPWNEHHWIKKRFFDAPPDPDILAITTNYLCNEWLDEADKKVFERMKKQNPRRYRVAGLGDWGIVDGLVYENWHEQMFSLKQIQEQHPDLKSGFGLDYGFTNDPSAAFIGFVDLETHTIYVWDEMYEKGLSNKKIYDTLCKMGYGKDKFTAESAEPKSNAELKGYGMRVKGAEKGKDSINNGIQWIQDCTIIIHPRCVNFLTEISNYTWEKDKFGNKLNVPIDDFNHLMDAMRYGLEQYIRNNKWLY
ncbi:PBSX family phage terminase large subunit [Ruminococcus sp. YE282]|uniref:PBSX family phage terminase large subunit n=1 Tax=Ruminococcus sp. YE282 TaxID=3158780 RepID=UPI00088EA986|nr:phage terminase large subunit [Ruminococcus bromii]